MRRTAAVAALAGVGAVIGAAAISTAGSSGQAPAPVAFTKQTFTVQERDTNDFAFIDNAPKTKVGRNGPRRLSPGDQIAFHNRIVENGKTVGGLYAHCMILTGRTFGTAVGDCTGAFKLPAGVLFVGVGGSRIFAGPSITGAVTGGTRAYAGATGTFVSPQKDNTTDTFTIFVPVG
jgi:hypothetical protein